MKTNDPNKCHGVVFNKCMNNWKSIMYEGRSIICLGYYETQKEAAIVSDRAYKEKYGENIRLNFPSPEPDITIQNTRWIRLSQGKFALVDEIHYERVNKYIWTAFKKNNTFYARTKILDKETGKNRLVFLHRFILGVIDKYIYIDHKDRNGLNNTENNLRLCDGSLNQMNRGKHKIGTSIYKGVYRDKNYGKYRARIIVKGVKNEIGSFINEIEAAYAYDKAAIKYFGEFACLNFPERMDIYLEELKAA